MSIKRTLRTHLSALLCHERGSVMLIISISVLLLVVAAAAAIDGERVHMLQAKMQSSLDAAGLATAAAALNPPYNGTMTNDQATQLAQKYFNLNFPTGYLNSQPIQIQATVDSTKNTISLTTGNTTQTMSMMQMAGVSSVQVGANSMVQFIPPVSGPACDLTLGIGQCPKGSTNTTGAGTWATDKTNPALGDWTCSNAGGNASCQLARPQCGSNPNSCAPGNATPLPAQDNNNYNYWSCANNGGSITCNDDVNPTCGSTINTCSSGSSPISESPPGAGGNATWTCQNTTTGVESSPCSLPAAQCSTTVNTCITGGVVAGSESTPTINGVTSDVWQCQLNGQTVPQCSDAVPQCLYSPPTIGGCSPGSTASTVVYSGTPGASNYAANWSCHNSATNITTSGCTLPATACGTTVNTCSNKGVVGSAAAIAGYTTWTCALNGQTTSACSDQNPLCSPTIGQCSVGTNPAGVGSYTADASNSTLGDWSCVNFGITINSCQAPAPINGQCGTVPGSCLNPGATLANPNQIVFNGDANGLPICGDLVAVESNDACSAAGENFTIAGIAMTGFQGDFLMSGIDSGTLPGTDSWVCKGINGGGNSLPCHATNGTFATPANNCYVAFSQDYISDTTGSISTGSHADDVTINTVQLFTPGCHTPGLPCNYSVSALNQATGNYVAAPPATIVTTAELHAPTAAYFGAGALLYPLPQGGGPPDGATIEGPVAAYQERNLCPLGVCFPPGTDSGDYLPYEAAVFALTNLGAIIGGSDNFVAPLNSIAVGPKAHLRVFNLNSTDVAGGPLVGRNVNLVPGVALDIQGPALIYNSCPIFGNACGSAELEKFGGDIFHPDPPNYYIGTTGIFGTSTPPKEASATVYADRENTITALFNKNLGNVVNINGTNVSMQSLFPPSARYWSGATTSAGVGTPAPSTAAPYYVPGTPIANQVPPAFYTSPVDVFANNPVSFPWPGDMHEWTYGILITCDP